MSLWKLCEMLCPTIVSGSTWINRYLMAKGLIESLEDNPNRITTSCLPISEICL